MGRLLTLASRIESAGAALLGRKQAERRPLLMGMSALSEGAGWAAESGVPRSHEWGQELDAYVDAVWPYAATYRIAVCLALAPLVIYQGDPEGKFDSLPPVHPARKLFADPNPWQSRFDLWEDTGLFLELLGEAPWELGGLPERYQAGSPEAFPKALMVLRPDLLFPVPGKDSYIKGYVLKVQGKEIRYRADEIMMIKWRDPKDDYRGLGSARPAKDAAQLDARAISYNRAQFDNLGVPAVVLEEEIPAGSPPLNDDQVKEIKRQWDMQFAGSKNAFRTRVAAGGLKVKEFGTTPRDMQYQEARRMNRQEILAAFGVPPALVGLYDTAIRANASEQRRDFWEDTMVPKLKKIEEALNSPESGLFWRFGPDIFCRFDLTQIPALREDANQRVTRRAQLFDRGAATRNELREAEGLAAMAGLDDVYIAGTYLPGGEAEPEKRAPRGRVGQKSAVTLRAEIRRSAHWKLLNAQWLSLEGDWRRESRAFFESQADRILARARKVNNADLIHADMLLPKDEEQEVMAEAFRPLVTKTVAHGGRWGMRLVRSRVAEVQGKRLRSGGRKAPLDADLDALEFDELHPDVRAFTMKLEQKLVEKVNLTTWEAVRVQLAEAQAGGESMLEIMDRLRVTLEQRRAPFELARIARTEVVKANNGGALLSYQQSGVVEEKEWLATRDDKTREAHAEVDGKHVPVASDFELPATETEDGDALGFPGDPRGRPGSIINCRCTMVPYFAELAEEA